MKKIKIIVPILALLVIAYFTNPSESDFKEFVKKDLKEDNSNVLEDLVDSGLSLQSQFTTDYQNRILFSTVSTKIGTKDAQFIGLFGGWFRTK